MAEAFYLGLGIVAFFVLNAMYMSWRGSQIRKEEETRENPFGGE
mgnify:CR=1 FL=1